MKTRIRLLALSLLALLMWQIGQLNPDIRRTSRTRVRRSREELTLQPTF